MSVYVTDDMSDEDVQRTRDLGLRIFKDADAELVRRQRVGVGGDARGASRHVPGGGVVTAAIRVSMAVAELAVIVGVAVLVGLVIGVLVGWRR